MKINFYILIILYSFQIVGQTVGKSRLYAKELKNANLYFDTEDYVNAITTYKKVLAIDPTDETANLNSMISRLKLNQSIDSCYPYLLKLKTSKLPEVQFYSGQIYHLASKFDEAINSFTNYKNIPAKLRTIPNTEVDYYISCSKNAKEFIGTPHRSVIKNIGNTINSSFDEYVPLVSLDDSVLYFTSRREGSTGNLKDPYGNYYEDVYVSKKTANDIWGKPKNSGPPINTNTHDACVALSFDGKELIIFRTSADQITGDLYICKATDSGWSIPEKLGAEINTPFIETSACFSNDSSVMYFSSNKPGGYGGKDLYRIKKLPNGRWSLPWNLGASVNTDKDEDAPYLHPDGATLYFSSKGHNTMGDFDVFKTSMDLETNQFSEPENLGYPINTVHSDRFFILNTNGSKGYYSSVKADSYGGSDIYMIDTRFGDNDMKVKRGRVMIGTENSKAKITIIDTETNQVTGVVIANSKTGRFIMALNPLKAYKAIVEEDGCHTMYIDIEPLANDDGEDNELILNLSRNK